MGKFNTQRKRRALEAREESALKIRLDKILTTFNHKDYLKTDPISFPHRYKKKEDQELIALIAALFSFGNVRSIKQTLEKLIEPLGRSPTKTLMNLNLRDLHRAYEGSYYRFFSEADILFLMGRLQGFLIDHQGSLKNFARATYQDDVIDFLKKFRKELLLGAPSTPGLRFMFPDPEAGCAKRFHMFLRWMVRKDDIDFGHWDFIPKSKLLVPLDTHVFQICRSLRFTKLASPSRSALIQITEKLRELDPEDPIKYDFAICRLGILGLKKDFLAKR